LNTGGVTVGSSISECLICYCGVLTVVRCLRVLLKVKVQHTIAHTFQDQQHFTILEVAADWDELIVPQCIIVIMQTCYYPDQSL